MNIDLTFWLLTICSVMAVILLLNRFIFVPRGTFSKEPFFVDWSKSFFSVLFFVFVLRTFLFEPFQIPSGSMIPTLKVGDFILVSKFSYGVRVPLAGQVVIPIKEPKRGDVVVFKPPYDKRHFIKRLIGLPGDVVEFKEHRLFINNVEVEQIYREKAVYNYTNGLGLQTTKILDAKTGDHAHQIQVSNDFPTLLSSIGVYKIPEGHYFMVGDNRDGSADSRSCFGSIRCNQQPSNTTPNRRGWSVVPDENIVGKAMYIWMHWDDFLSMPSFSRSGKIH